MKEDELPPGWAWAALGEIALVNPSTDLSEIADDTELSFVPMAAVEAETGKLDPSQTRQYSEIKKKSLTKFQEGDILFAKITPCMENGKIAVAAALVGGLGFGSTEFHVIRPMSGISTRYLLNYLLQKSVRTEAERNMTGAVGQRRVPTGYLRELRVPLPPIDEQERIVDDLEDHLSRLDYASSLIARSRHRIPRLIAASFDRIALGDVPVERDLIISDREDLSQIEHSPNTFFDYRNLPRLPDGWLWRRADEVCTSVQSGSTPKADLMSPGSGDVPFLKVYNLTKNGSVDFSINPTFVSTATHEGKLKRSKVLPGDVLTNIVGPPLGKTVIVTDEFPEWNINQAIAAFRAGAEIDSGWLLTALRSPFVFGLLKATSKATAGQFNVSISACRALPIPVPPIQVQRELVEQSEILTTNAHSIESMLLGAVRESNGLRASVLQRVFSGQLISSNGSPEPASVLLERIKTERDAQSKTKRKRTLRSPAASTRPAPSISSDPAGTFVQEELGL